MTPAEHAELSAQVARAIGYYPESVELRKWSDITMVFRICDVGYGPRWVCFDYRDPSVAMPLLEWLMQAPRHIHVTRWRDGHSDYEAWRADCLYAKADTLCEAIARAAIAVGGGK